MWGILAVITSLSFKDVLDFFLNKENSEMATASRHWFWLVLVAGSHANP
jgi:hypothetical protein